MLENIRLPTPLIKFQNMIFPARDVVKTLIESNTTKTNDFNWMSQLRYYWRNGTAIVSMVTTEINYGFEYLGNTPRLVITPLTDRCYRYALYKIERSTKKTTQDHFL